MYEFEGKRPVTEAVVPDPVSVGVIGAGPLPGTAYISQEPDGKPVRLAVPKKLVQVG